MSDRAGWRALALEWAKTIGGALVAYVAFTTLAFANYRIPSESMAPHLEVGDIVTVSKFSYGFSRHSLPFNLGALLPEGEGRLLQSLPRRGDVAVFIQPITGEVLIKRAIGLPGDVIAVRGGALYINGQRVVTSTPEVIVRAVRPEGVSQRAEHYNEALPEGLTHAVYNLTDVGALDDFGPYAVPEGHVFFMGDNRDNSADSRWAGMGPVPVENLIGRAEIVLATTPCLDERAAPCPRARWLRPLHN